MNSAQQLSQAKQTTSKVLASAAVLVMMIAAAATSAFSAPAPKAVSVTTTITCATPAACSTAAAELQMFQMLNNDRASQAHVQQLQWDAKLAEVARQHSQEMANRAIFQHVSADGSQPSDRLDKAGVAWTAMAENIALDQDIASAEANFMNEPKYQENHRGNILNATFTNVGIGIVVGQNGTLYITQEFVQAQ